MISPQCLRINCIAGMRYIWMDVSHNCTFQGVLVIFLSGGGVKQS
jgi:hypothetical protein